MENEVYWLSPLGDRDDFGRLYGTGVGSIMIDGKTKQGPWANMTEASWLCHGIGRLGTGYGQKYVKQTNGRWLKVEG